MATINTFLGNAHNRGADKKPHFVIVTVDGQRHPGPISALTPDSVMLKTGFERTSGNPEGTPGTIFIPFEKIAWISTVD